MKRYKMPWADITMLKEYTWQSCRDWNWVGGKRILERKTERTERRRTVENKGMKKKTEGEETHDGIYFTKMPCRGSAGATLLSASSFLIT